jgi:hypothetical protein
MPTISDVTSANFAPELRAILEAEIAAGNSISEVRTGSPVHDAVVVVLENPFLTPLRAASANVRFRQVNLPGWWRAEYTAAQPPHTLACR